MQGAEERRLKRMSNTLQGGASDGNAADGALMVDQGPFSTVDKMNLKGHHRGL